LRHQTPNPELCLKLYRLPQYLLHESMPQGSGHLQNHIACHGINMLNMIERHTSETYQLSKLP